MIPIGYYLGLVYVLVHHHNTFSGENFLFLFYFRINDRVISANNVSLEGVDYATAVQVLRDSGQTVDLVVKRRVVLPPSLPAPNAMDQTKLFNVHLQRLKKKEDFGIVLGKLLYFQILMILICTIIFDLTN